MTAAWPPTAPLVPDVGTALPFLNRAIDRQRDAALNVEGGDPGGFGSPLLVARHVANYQAAADAVSALGAPDGAVLDVGCGVGALSAWTADRLGRDLVLCDQDAAVVAFGGETFGVPVVTDLAEAESAPVVLAMEVLEHVPPGGHEGFLGALWSRVRPGGILVLSTPDETSYPGGWSGYAPHVGCVSPRALHDLLDRTTDGDAQVWRLDGGPYDMSWPRRALERVANTAWTAVQRGAPRVAERLASRGGRQAALELDDVQRAATPFTLVDPRHGTGTGLLAVVQRRA